MTNKDKKIMEQIDKWEKPKMTTRSKICFWIFGFMVVFAIVGLFTPDENKQPNVQKQPNAKQMRDAMLNYEIMEDRAVNDFQEKKVRDSRQKYITGYYAVDWYGEITKIDSYGEVKLDTEISGIWLYFDINSSIAQVGNWRVGDRIEFSGRIGKLAFISYKINIDSIKRVY